MKKIFKEFKEFAIKGNVIDMAVGVIIGGAFGKIVTSLVGDIVMPAISLITGRVSLKSLALTVPVFNSDTAPIVIKYGEFLQNTLDFLIVAISIFFMVKVINMLKRKQEEAPKPPPKPSNEEVLLTEIRDVLKDK